MLGCDIVEIERVKEALNKFGEKFVDRILSGREKEIFQKRKKPVTFLAGRFCAKESLSKSFKTGIGDYAGWKDIEILVGEKGEPIVFFHGTERPDIEVSISHSRDYAVAVSIIK